MKIVAHHDADGLSSAILLLKSLNAEPEDVDLSFPDDFGDTSASPDFMVDMRPDSDEFDGTCIDHHPGHSVDRSYKLIWGEEPASVVCFNNFSSLIPTKDSWYSAVGAMGDGQPEKIPTIAFKLFPELLDFERIRIKQGFTTFKDVPKYRMISSPVNGLIRLGEPKKALMHLWECESPDDIFKVDEFIEAKNKISSKVNSIINSKDGARSKKISNHFTVWVINTKYNVGGIVASRDSNDNDVTSIVYNKRLGKGNCRGDLSKLVEEKLVENGISCGGHYGFVGFNYKYRPGRVRKLFEIIRDAL